MMRPLLQERDSARRPKFVVCKCGLEVLLLLALEPLADHAEGLRELHSRRLLRLLLRLLLLLLLLRRMQRLRLRHLPLLHGRGRRRGLVRLRISQFKNKVALARRALHTELHVLHRQAMHTASTEALLALEPKLLRIALLKTHPPRALGNRCPTLPKPWATVAQILGNLAPTLPKHCATIAQVCQCLGRGFPKTEAEGPRLSLRDASRYDTRFSACVRGGHKCRRQNPAITRDCDL